MQLSNEPLKLKGQLTVIKRWCFKKQVDSEIKGSQKWYIDGYNNLKINPKIILHEMGPLSSLITHQMIFLLAMVNI